MDSTKEPKTTAVYLRVSSLEQATHGFGMQAQEQALVDKAKDAGYRFDVYSDAGISGRTVEGRPAMVRLLAEVAAGRVGRILVTSEDRLTRSDQMAEWLQIGATLQGAGVKVETLTKSYDFGADGDGTDVLVVLIQFYLAGEENRARIARLLGGREQSAKLGRWIVRHRVPYGFTLDAESRSLMLDPQRAAVVLRLFSLVLDGLSIDRIAKVVDAEGIPPPATAQGEPSKAWYQGQVQKMLRRRVYVGEGQYGKETFAVPAIVDRQTFDRVQEELDRRHERHWHGRRKHSYPLRSKLRCGKCGRYLIGTSGGTKKRPLRYYRCNRRHVKGKAVCDLPYVRADHVENTVLRRLLQTFADPDGWLPGPTRDTKKVVLESERLSKQLESMKARRERVASAIVDALADGTITRSDAHKKTARVEAQIAQLERQLSRAVELEAEVLEREELRTALKAEAKKLPRPRRSRVGEPVMAPEDMEKLFDRYVDTVVVHSRHWIRDDAVTVEYRVPMDNRVAPHCTRTAR